MNKAKEEFDVVIVGAGVAGCYAAYRLMNQKKSPRVGLFEYSGRVGGRLLSTQLPQQANHDKPIGAGLPTPRKYAEFGGFRFQNQMHIVRDLAVHLNLEEEPFPVDEPPNNIVYVRGKRLTRQQVNAGEDLPYFLTPFELDIVQGKYAKTGNPDLGTYVSNQTFSGFLPNGPGYDDSAGCDSLPNGYQTLRTAYQCAFKEQRWEQVKAYRQQYEATKQDVVVDGRSFKDWSWWALRTRFLSPEAIAFMEDTGGYNSRWAPGNVSSELAEDFYFANESDVFGPDGSPDPCTQTVWSHIITGYSDIPNQLYTNFCDAGGKGFLNHQLLSFNNAADGTYELNFFKRKQSVTTSTVQGEDACNNSQDCVSVQTAQLILALPQRALQLLDQNNFFFQGQTPKNGNVSDLLNSSVLNDPAIRIFMAYDKPWWTSKKLCCGRSTTDLPVRQFYYWYTEEDEGNQDSFLLASYSNAEAEKYWYSLEVGDEYNSVPGGAVDDRHDSPQHGGPRGATATMAQLAHQQIMETVGVTDAPEPYYAHYQNWVKDPWGAGWHAWTAGNSDNKLIPVIQQLLPTEKVYICGECYSNVQGWVQGALNSTEVMLQNKFALSWPEWLSEGGTWLGPGSSE